MNVCIKSVPLQSLLLLLYTSYSVWTHHYILLVRKTMLHLWVYYWAAEYARFTNITRLAFAQEQTLQYTAMYQQLFHGRVPFFITGWFNPFASGQQQWQFYYCETATEALSPWWLCEWPMQGMCIQLCVAVQQQTKVYHLTHNLSNTTEQERYE